MQTFLIDLLPIATITIKIKIKEKAATILKIVEYSSENHIVSRDENICCAGNRDAFFPTIAWL